MIPYGRQSIDEDDIAAVVKVLEGDFLTTGPKIAEFEKAICDETHAKHAVVCSNGTAALHLASHALGLTHGDAVIVPSLTFLATANAVRYCDAEVIFADVNPDTGLMEREHLEEAMSRVGDHTLRAVYPVHLTGQCVDLAALAEVTDYHGIRMVADGAHAFGGEVDGKPVGACVYEDMTTFSFHPVKTIAAGEGGTVVTNDEHAAEKMRRFRSHGMIPTPDEGPWAYEMPELGYNYRLTDFQCALAISQMKKLERFVARRWELAHLYDQLLESLAPLVKRPVHEHYDKPALHLYAPRFDFSTIGKSRADVMNELRAHGIGTQVHYIPVHTQPYYRKRYGALDLRGAEDYYRHTLSLPLYPAMSDDDVAFVVGRIKEVIGA